MRDSCFMIPRQRHSKRSLFIRQIESIQSLGPFFLLLKISTLIRKQRREAITISFRLHPIAISQRIVCIQYAHTSQERDSFYVTRRMVRYRGTIKITFTKLMLRYISRLKLATQSRIVRLELFKITRIRSYCYRTLKMQILFRTIGMILSRNFRH